MPRTPPRPPRPPDPADPVTPERVLRWLDLLRLGIGARDEMFVWELFGYREARAAPRAVLEEALALVRAPAGSLRAPLALLRFAWAVRHLDAAGEPMPGAAAPDSARAGDGGGAGEQLELAWPRARRRPA